MLQEDGRSQKPLVGPGGAEATVLAHNPRHDTSVRLMGWGVLDNMRLLDF